MTLTVLKEETEFLKTLVFSLDTENAELQQQLLDFEAETTGLKSTIATLERENLRSNETQCEDVVALVQKLEESTRRVGELECQRSELHDEIQRQAVSFAALYAELHKHESSEDMVRVDEWKSAKSAEEKSLLEVLEEEKAELKAMVERLDAEMMAHKSESSELKLQMEALQTGNVEIVTKLEAEIQSKRELEAERDKLEADLNLFMEQLEMAQAMADERDEARKVLILPSIHSPVSDFSFLCIMRDFEPHSPHIIVMTSSTSETCSQSVSGRD